MFEESGVPCPPAGDGQRVVETEVGDGVGHPARVDAELKS
jgi:hypothetical protein